MERKESRFVVNLPGLKCVMFRHQGKFRNHKHNLRIAALLSLVAGIVNVTGFLAIGRLTTNVTGHFAFFIDDVSRHQYFDGFVFLVYILSFLGGAFVSGLLMELTSGKKIENFFLPVILESAILVCIAILAEALSGDLIACSLLFAMGLQNALVTKISRAIVRTTHLTGLFTDLGIELSQLLFKKDKHLQKTVMLRLNIILFFFLGGLAGGFFYSRIQLYSLSLAAGLLVAGLLFDHFRYRAIKYRRKRGIKKLQPARKLPGKAA